MSASVVTAFLERRNKKVCNVKSNNNSLFLFDTEIARMAPDGSIMITTANYPSITTKRYLNKIPNVRVYHKNYNLYLNDQLWNGNWTPVN